MSYTWLDVDFTGKGTGKSQVRLQPSQLPDPEPAEAAKGFWQETLSNLKELLEHQD